MVTIIDDFIEPELHKWMCGGIIENKYFPWYFQPVTVGKPENLKKSIYPTYTEPQYNYNHLMHSEEGEVSSWTYLVQPIIDKLGGSDRISRLKVNSVIKQPEPKVHGWHRDQPEEDIKIAIYYLNTTNGYTLLEDGTQIDSVANRLVKFSNNMLHTCVSQTDTQRRVVVNINYY